MCQKESWGAIIAPKEANSTHCLGTIQYFGLISVFVPHCLV